VKSLLLVLAGLVGCGPLSPEETATRLDDAVAGVVRKKDDVRHAVLHVHAPSLGVTGTWAHGEATEGGPPMTVDVPFLSASVGKLFTAATVVARADDGQLELDESIEDVLPMGMLEGLPARPGITIADLLAHRSGLPDFFVGPTVDGTPTVLDQWVASPDRAWSRDDLLDHVREHQEAVDGFVYSDTNYELLGFVIEQVTGASSYQEEVRRRIIDPLQLTATRYHHPLDGEAPEPDWAEAWVDDVPLAHAACLSGEQAGGGLVTTAQDLGRFLRALADGEIVPIDALEGGPDRTDDAIARGIDYGYGLWQIRPGGVFFTLGGMPEMMGASGATGSFAYYVPELDAVITGTFDQTSWQERHVRFVLSKVMPALLRVEAP